MGKHKRRSYSNEFKAKVALDALRGIETIQELAKRYEVHPTQITQWKNHALDYLPEAFNSGKKQEEAKEHDELVDGLFRKIGQLNYELDWVKKKSDRFS